MTSTAAISISGLVKDFGSTRALDRLDLTVRPGEVHGFLGPNGSGKTTTVRILLGLLRKSAGEVTVLGEDPWSDAVSLHRRLAYVPVEVNLWPNLTGGEVIDGASFINVLADCPLGWRHEARIGARISQLAVETRFWPLYEVVDGRYRLTYEPRERVPVIEWLRPQGRFAHLLAPERATDVQEIQDQIDADWDTLVARCAA